MESLEKVDGRLIYWFGGEPRRGLIICRENESCVTDEIASGYELAYETFGKALDSIPSPTPGPIGLGGVN